MSNSGPSSGYSALPPPAHSLRSYTPSALALLPLLHFLRSCTSSGSTSSGPGHRSGLNIS